MTNLFCFQNRIHGNENATGCAGAKQRSHRFDLFRQVDGDPLIAFDTQGPEPGCCTIDLVEEFPVAEHLFFEQ